MNTGPQDWLRGCKSCVCNNCITLCQDWVRSAAALHEGRPVLAAHDGGPAPAILDARTAAKHAPGYEMGRSWREGEGSRGRCWDGPLACSERPWGDTRRGANYRSKRREKNSAAATQPWGQRVREQHKQQHCLPVEKHITSLLSGCISLHVGR